jgi:hypothetical protein
LTDSIIEHRPRCDFEAYGPLTIRGPVDIGDLTCTALLCKDPSCQARSAFFRGVLSAREGGADATVDLMIDIDSGYAIPSGASTSDRVQEVAAWLADNLTGILLDALHQRSLEAKGKRLDPDAWRTDDWAWWVPGKVIAWREVEPDGRLDLYVANDRGYSALDYYCANPSCNCQEAQVVFQLPGEGATMRKVGAVTLGFEGGERTAVSELAPDHTEEQLAALGAHFLRRHGRARLAERLRRVRQVVGPELLRRRAAPSREGPPGATGKRRARPNDPCPCGSGKKFKKCCGTEG